MVNEASCTLQLVSTPFTIQGLQPFQIIQRDETAINIALNVYLVSYRRSTTFKSSFLSTL